MTATSAWLLSSKADSIHSRVNKMRDTAKEQMKGIRRLLSGDVVMARAALPEAHRENYARTGRKYLRCERELEPVGGCDPWMVPGARIEHNSLCIPFRFEIA